jgi:predicted kinase
MEPVFVLVGAPAAGKSTTARVLGRRPPKAIHVPVDDVRMMVVSGLVMPSMDWAPELVDQVRVAREAAIAMTRTYQAAGFAVIVDDFWDPHGLAEYRELFDEATTHRIVLHPPIEEARRRNRARGTDPDYIDAMLPFAYGVLAPELPTLPERGWILLDDAALTPEATADAIMAFAGVAPAVRHRASSPG